MWAVKLLIVCVLGVAAAKKFKDGDRVELIANNVGPFANPTETYRYYSLPFCRPESIEKHSQELGEVLAGDRRVSTLYDIRFLENAHHKTLCRKSLSVPDVLAFAKACEDDYYFELFLDDIPMWGYVGEHEHEDLILGHMKNSRHFLYTHLHFSIAHNDGHVIAVNVSTDPTQRFDITDAMEASKIPVEFTYSVQWTATDVTYEHRGELLAESHFLPTTLEIHWLSVINSLVLVILLTAFLAVILLRIVKNDFTQYMRADEEDGAPEEETGWKLVHGDVFRVPGNANLLSAFIGAGAHLFVTTIATLSLAVCGAFSAHRRGSILTAVIVLYALTAGVGGFVSARMYKKMKGVKWAWNIVSAYLVFPVPLATCFFGLNWVAVAHSTTAALPFGTIVVIMALFLVVAFPLTVLGGIAGHNSAIAEPPCRVVKVPRQIPTVVWYRSAWAQTLAAGFFPFSAVSIELHYIFASIWGRRVYTLYGILFIAFLLLSLVTGFIVIAMTYFQLAAEDHRWWWRSFISGGMISVFVYGYCFFYYHTSSEMTGFLQTSFYFGYMAVASFAAFLMLGFVGFMSTQRFVHYIYSSIKVE